MYGLMRFDHPLLFDYDISSKMNVDDFMKKIFKLNKEMNINSYYKFERYLKTSNQMETISILINEDIKLTDMFRSS